MCRDAFRHAAVSEATEGIVEVLQVATSTPPPPHAARAAPSTLSPSPLANVIGPSLPAGPSLPGVGGGELYEQIGLDLLGGTLKAVVGFVLGTFKGWFGLRYNHIITADETHERIQFVNALLNTHLPYPCK